MSVIKVQIEVEGLPNAVTGEVSGSIEAILELVHPYLSSGEIFIFERDKPELFEHHRDRCAIALVAHRARVVLVKVHFEHRTEHHEFAPSATVQTVLRWAVGHHGFKLDENQAAKANLMLPGASEPLVRDIAIGTLFRHDESRPCELTLELTLKDFTNG